MRDMNNEYIEMMAIETLEWKSKSMPVFFFANREMVGFELI